MIALLAILAAALIALGLIGALAYAIRRTTISIVIRKDPDMATIKERLAALEAIAADHGDTLATKADLAAVTARVDGIDVEIGEDPAPAGAVATPTPAPAAPLTSADAAAPFA